MMAFPTTPTGSWFRDLDLPSRLFPRSGDDYELYEEDGEFVLTVEMPGFDAEDIDVAWDDGRLTVSAEHEDETRGRQRTYHRSFRFPKEIDDEAIGAEYTNGVLEIRLPIAEGAAASGREIPVET